MRKALFFLLPFFALIGCGVPEYTIVSDPVWIESFRKEEGGKALVKALEKETGKNISLMPGELVGEKGYIDEILSRSRGETVILSPLFSGPVDQQWTETGGKKVILLSYFPQNTGASTRGIQLSRREAFRKAGEACARLLLEEPDVYGSTAAAVFYTATPRRREEMAQFKAGYTSLNSGDTLTIFEIAAVEDRKTLKPFLDELKRSNTRIALIAASRLNIFCLEECAKEDVYVLMEEGSGFDVFQENILGSIEIDRFELLRTAVLIPFEELAGTVVEAEFVQK